MAGFDEGASFRVSRRIALYGLCIHNKQCSETINEATM